MPQPTLTRRLAMLLGLAAVIAPNPDAPWPPTSRASKLRALLAALLPPSLPARQLGAQLRASRPATFAACLARAGVCQATLTPAHLAAQVAEDFAAGRVVSVAGWHLARTEAWLCAALDASA